MDCGFEVPFLEEIDQRFMCPICLLLLRKPMQTACGHRFCDSCIKRVIPFSNSVLTCPVDKIFTRVNQMFPDLATEREILSMNVQCTNFADKCTWRGEIREMDKHRLVCEMENVLCTNTGCQIKIKRKDAKDHQITCPNRLTKCLYCKEKIFMNVMEKHHGLCLKIPVVCSLCMMMLPREQLAKHQSPDEDLCPKVSIKCPYSYIGCKFQSERHLMANHTQGPDALSEHMELSLKWMNHQGDFVKELARSVHELQEKNRSVIPALQQNDNKHKQATSELRERNVTGKLHWKVKIAEIRHQCVKYVSPAFYTGCPGYKVQLILDMEGPREGSTKYTSLSLALLHGDYDSQVIFPFNATCIVTLFDQTKCPPQHKMNITSQLVVREVPKNNSENAFVDRIHKRDISKYFKRPELTGSGSRYLKNGCLHFEVVVIHSYYPPEGVFHLHGCLCPTLLHGHELAHGTRWAIPTRSDITPTQVQMTPIMQVAAMTMGN